MAVVTLLAAAAVVYVVRCMAAETGSGRIAERTVRVAIAAGGFPMAAEQREPGRVVIEIDVPPIDRGMAVATLLPHEALVCVVVAVTSDAVPGGVALFRSRRMAILTGGLEMSAEQRKIREGMVEGIAVEYDDFRVAPFVFGVTVGAGVVSRIAVPPVKTGGLCYVTRNVFMTGRTEIALAPAIKGSVTGAALRLDVCVRFHNGSGHYQGLDALCARRR